MPDIFSRVSFDEIVNDIISWAVIAVLGAVIVYLWKALRQFLSSTAEGGRRHARADIRKRVRSDEYHAERQKIEVHAFIITAGAFVSFVSMIPHAEVGAPSARLHVFIMFFAFLGGMLLIVLEAYRNGVEKRRAKRLSATMT